MRVNRNDIPMTRRIPTFLWSGCVLVLLATSVQKVFGDFTPEGRSARAREGFELFAALAMLPGMLVGYMLSCRTAGLLDRGYTRTAVLVISTASSIRVIQKPPRTRRRETNRVRRSSSLYRPHTQVHSSRVPSASA